MTTGRAIRGISSPGQAGSARIDAGIGRDALDRQPGRAQALGGVRRRPPPREPVMLGIRTSATRSRDERARSIEAAAAAPASARASIVSRAGSAGSGTSARPSRSRRSRRARSRGPRRRPPRARAAVTGLPSATITTPGRTASTLQPSVGYSSSGTSISRTPSSAEPAPTAPTGRSGRKTTARSSLTGEMTDIRWTSSAGPFQYGRSTIRTSPPTIAASWRAPCVVRAERPADDEQVVAEPDRVAALDRAGRLDPARRRDAARRHPAPRGSRARRHGSACPAGAGSRRPRSTSSGSKT